MTADIQALGPDIQLLTPEHQTQLQNILQQRLTARGASQLDGPTYQRVQSELGTIAQRYLGSPDADQRALGEMVTGVSQALENAARRQNPQFSAEMDQLDHGWALYRRAADASGRGNAEGIFTPAQYSGAIRRGDGREGKLGFARGEALGQRYADAGRNVLPSNLNDSGTARRSMVGNLLNAGSSIGGATAGAVMGHGPTGAVLGAVAGPAVELGMLGAMARAYSPQAIAAYNAALDQRISGQARAQALYQLQQMAGRDPRLMALATRAAGVLGASRSATPAQATSPQ